MAARKTKTVEDETKVVATLPVAENREIRLIVINVENGPLLRIGLYKSLDGQPYAGATFPLRMLPELNTALQKLETSYKGKL
jgi:hypothetical protein